MLEKKLSLRADERPVLPADELPKGTAGRILEAAVVRFATTGFRETSVREIAADVGINHATLYSHFASKDELLLAVLMLRHRSVEQEFELSGGPVTDDPRVRIALFMRAGMTAVTQYPFLAAVYVNEMQWLAPELAAPLLTLYKGIIAATTRTIQDGIEQERFRTVPAELATGALGGLIEQATRWVAQNSYNDEEMTETYVDFALKMLSK
ncbi:TetR/AcrR family transcriptional regulator [Microbacterium sp. NPDC091662]|uniref:TetR/AcrR family transcriptional regulator n=1 Tax=Microbacterium sp. NPDC091662 TaxID=3364211 RepID=UPI0038003854